MPGTFLGDDGQYYFTPKIETTAGFQSVYHQFHCNATKVTGGSGGFIPMVLPFYVDDIAATLGGVAIGDYYIVDEGSGLGDQYGTVRQNVGLT